MDCVYDQTESVFTIHRNAHLRTALMYSPLQVRCIEDDLYGCHQRIGIRYRTLNKDEFAGWHCGPVDKGLASRDPQLARSEANKYQDPVSARTTFSAAVDRPIFGNQISGYIG